MIRIILYRQPFTSNVRNPRAFYGR